VGWHHSDLQAKNVDFLYRFDISHKIFKELREINKFVFIICIFSIPQISLFVSFFSELTRRLLNPDVGRRAVRFVLKFSKFNFQYVVRRSKR